MVSVIIRLIPRHVASHLLTTRILKVGDRYKNHTGPSAGPKAILESSSALSRGNVV